MAIRMTGSGTRSFADNAASAARDRIGVPLPNIRFNGPPDGSITTCRGGVPTDAPNAFEITIR
jgi:hypothetical protein